MEIAEQVARILLEIRAVTLSPGKPYTYASGIRSPIYCDNRLLMSYPEKREKIIQCFLETIKQNRLGFDVIGGIATAGIPHAAWLAEKLGVPMIYVRSEAKEHGKQNQIEGMLKKGQKVLMIEDLISTGGSSTTAIKAVQEAGAKVEACIAIFTYEMEKARNAFNEAECSLYPLSNFSTLVSVAGETGYVDAGQKEIILEWNKNPAAWGEKYAAGK